MTENIRMSHKTHTPQEAADQIGTLYFGDHDRYFREKLVRGYQRAAALNSLVKVGVESEGEDVTADHLIWNQEMNVELVNRAMKDGKFNLTEEIIGYFFQSWHTGRPVGEFLDKEHAEALPLYEEQRNSHLRFAFEAEQYDRHKKLNSGELSQEEVDKEVDKISLKSLEKGVKVWGNAIAEEPEHENVKVWQSMVDTYKRAIARKND